MKKFLGILVLGLLVCSNSFAGKIAVKKAIKLPKDIVQGYKNKWNFSCTWTENGNYEKHQNMLVLVSRIGFEPMTPSLKGKCSTN